MVMVVWIDIFEGRQKSKSEGSGYNEIDYNSFKMSFRTVYSIELECILYK